MMKRINDFNKLKFWSDKIPLDYRYTAGIAGERFLKLLSEKGSIFATRCLRCSSTYVPPRIYCVKCFRDIDRWVDVGLEGEVYSYTTAHVSRGGKMLKRPVIYALIAFRGCKGGLIHKLRGFKAGSVSVGMKVKAVIKPKSKRKGSIRDIEHFAPVK